VASSVLGYRAKLAVKRAYFSRLVPRRVRDAQLDWSIRRVAPYPDPPITFNAKLHYKMVNDRRPLLTTFADKVAVRRYIETKVGRHVLTDLFLVTEDAKLVRREALPREFVLKPSHGAGGCIVSEKIASTEKMPDQHPGWSGFAVSPNNSIGHCCECSAAHGSMITTSRGSSGLTETSRRGFW
jgi:hypothetical protein